MALDINSNIIFELAILVDCKNAKIQHVTVHFQNKILEKY
jgi:hypothetical protein